MVDSANEDVEEQEGQSGTQSVETVPRSSASTDQATDQIWYGASVWYFDVNDASSLQSTINFSVA